jgi:hypothetical protein
MYRSQSASSQSPLHIPQVGYETPSGNVIRGYDYATEPNDSPYGGTILGNQGVGNISGTTTPSTRVHYEQPAESNHPFNIAQTAQEQRYTTVPLGPPNGAGEAESYGRKKGSGMFGGVFGKTSGEFMGG